MRGLPGGFREFQRENEEIDQLSIQEAPYHSERANPRQSMSHQPRTARQNLHAIQADFESHLVAHGVIPDKDLLLNEPPLEPRNIHQIREYLVSRPVFISEQQFRQLDYASQYLNEQGESVLLRSFMLEGTNPSNYTFDIEFNDLVPITNETLHARPDVYCGSEYWTLRPEILEELSGYISPSKRTHAPIVPNFFLELEGYGPKASRTRGRVYHLGI